MIVSEFMTTEIISLGPNKTIDDAARLMIEKNVSELPVVDSESRLLGIITENDFVGKNIDIPHALAEFKQVFGHIIYHDGVEEIYKNSKGLLVEEVMDQSPKIVRPDYSLNDVVDLMAKYNLRRILVVEDGKLVGIISRHDILKAFAHLS